MLKHLKTADVHAIIAAAEKVNAAHPASQLGTDLEEARLKMAQPDPEGDALFQLVNTLSKEETHELIALMWLGRGDVPGTFEENLVEARKVSTETGDSGYIVEKAPALPAYLRAGLNILTRG